MRITQNVDFTGVNALAFDAMLRSGGVWSGSIRAEVRIDGVTVWSNTAQGAYQNQNVYVGSYTGVHSLQLQTTVMVAGTYDSQWVLWDNLRMLTFTGYLSVGTITSPTLAPAAWQQWGILNFTKNTASAGTALVVDVLNSAAVPIARDVPAGTDLNTIPAVASQSAIRVRAILTTSNSANTPRLDDWSLAWNTLPSTVESAWSSVASSVQDSTGPALTVTSAVTTLTASHSVAGMAGDANGIQGVTVNGVAASSADAFLHWTSSATLAPGWNPFTIIASDSAVPANTTTAAHTVYLATATSDADGDGLPDAWELAHGLDLFNAAGNAGAQGDPDRDGIPHLLELAFGLDPLAADVGGLPVAASETDPADGQPYLTVRYRRLLTPGALLYGIEVSSDLATWTSTPADFEELTPAIPTGDGLTETVTVRIRPALTTPGNATRQARIRVTAP